jgi:hypothetical protein
LRPATCAGEGKDAELVVVAVERYAKLPQIVDALAATGRFAGGLDGWQQERDEDADDGNDDEKLHEGEGLSRD